jgi:hypothetical protein
LSAKKCLHCGRSKVNRPRGLCWTCYYTDGVRENYSCDPVFGRRGVSNGHIEPRLAPSGTEAIPGTEAKIQVMAERAAVGLSIFHPDDRYHTLAALAWKVPIGRYELPLRDCSWHGRLPDAGVDDVEVME